MTLRIDDEAPDLTAETTEGTIRFHGWFGDGWALLAVSDEIAREKYPGGWRQALPYTGIVPQTGKDG